MWYIPTQQNRFDFKDGFAAFCLLIPAIVIRIVNNPTRFG